MRWFSTGAGGPSVFRGPFQFMTLDGATFCLHHVAMLSHILPVCLTLGSSELGI